MSRVHIAIMRRSWGLTEKILKAEKTVETRWYKHRYRPWGQINKGEVIYFKDSGGPVTVKAIVSGVEQFEVAGEADRKRILERYSERDLGVSEIASEIDEYTQGKRYCVVIHLSDPKKVEPFDIDKRGYGMMASWLVTDDIEKLKLG